MANLPTGGKATAPNNLPEILQRAATYTMLVELAVKAGNTEGLRVLYPKLQLARIDLIDGATAFNKSFARLDALVTSLLEGTDNGG